MNISNINFGKLYCKKPNNNYHITKNQNLLNETVNEIFNPNTSRMLETLNRMAGKDVVLIMNEDGSAILKTQDSHRQRINEEDLDNPLIKLKQKTIRTTFPLKKFTCFDTKKVEDFYEKCNNYLKAIERKTKEQYLFN